MPADEPTAPSSGEATGGEPTLGRPARVLRDFEPCSHPGCLSHRSHPCEGCGRIGGRAASSVSGTGEGEEPEEDEEFTDDELSEFLRLFENAPLWTLKERRMMGALRLRLSELEAERDALQRYQRLQSEEGTLTAIKDIARQLADSRRQLQAVQQEVEGIKALRPDYTAPEEYVRAVREKADAILHPQEGASPDGG